MKYNINYFAAYDYLQAFQALSLPKLAAYSSQDNAEYRRLIKHIAKIQTALKDKNLPQRNPSKFLELYTRLHELAENITVKENPDIVLKDELLAFHKLFFISLYENDSKLFERINQNIIQGSENSRKSQEKHIDDQLEKLNIHKPGLFEITHPGNLANELFSGLFGLDYNPLKRTNVPYISFPSDGFGPTTLRMGTQIQGMSTLQPAFLNYLACKNTAKDPSKPFHHVYFNLLKRETVSFESYFESKKSKSLESINGMSLGTAVITLPADNALFFKGFNKQTGHAKSNELFYIPTIKKELINSIKENKNDFYIPENVKNIIFANGLEQEITKLFAESLRFVAGPMVSTHIDAKMRQAVLFDFVKFRLSNFIVEKLNPDTINFSCKDAIDRGGVHALWFEMRRRLEKGTPMSEAEFNMHLDASALLVKGRPVNDHRILIWNILNESYSHHPQAYAKQSWVAQWIKNNCPASQRIAHLQLHQTLVINKTINVDVENELKHVRVKEKVNSVDVCSHPKPEVRLNRCR